MDITLSTVLGEESHAGLAGASTPADTDDRDLLDAYSRTVSGVAETMSASAVGIRVTKRAPLKDGTSERTLAGAGSGLRTNPSRTISTFCIGL